MVITAERAGELNDFLGRVADCDDIMADPHGMGKRVPYHGWYYRSLPWDKGYVPIARGHGLTGFCQSNKWGHPERFTTPEETAELVRLVEVAMMEDRDEDADGLAKALDDLWDYIQTLKIEDDE